MQNKVIKPAVSEEYRFIVTGYSEAKDAILSLKNANRPIAQDTSYLDWRYQQLYGAPQPLVFWVVSESGERVGMASLIFRPYWINGKATFLAVLGDISLDVKLRGVGLGQQLLEFVTGYIDANLSNTIAFVMPNAAARRSLSAAGWKITGKMVPHVFLLNPGKKLLPLLRSQWLASKIGKLFKGLMWHLLALRMQKGCSIQLVDQLDESFDSFWQNYPKAHLILRDRSAEALSWRFLNHPYNRIRIASVVRKGELIGYLAFELSSSDREVVIHDLVVAKEDDIGCVATLFVLKCYEFGDICTIRFLTSDCHPIETRLAKLGFVRRKSESIIQVHSVAGVAVDFDFVWALTWGDKDI